MFNYKWNLSDGYPSKGIEPHNLKVFSTFACGGGSSMGYKLAGYDVIGANDIDPHMAKVYKENHHPKHFVQAPVKDLLTAELPQELFELDILDGSPPCSTFSMAGSREKAWGKNKMFREGQSKQVLDDLFFDFIQLVGRLKPKVVIAENVKGLLSGNAKGYVLEIKKQLIELGYDVQIFLLNAATMGVPQKRERVFVICNRMNFPKLKLEFNENPITFGQVREEKGETKGLSQLRKELLSKRKHSDKSIGDINVRLYGKVSGFNAMIRHDEEVCGTITSTECDYRYLDGLVCTKKELVKIGSFPMDYIFLNNIPKYLVGMSVPPVMMAQIAYQVYLQWFKL